jgi:hypothetical protein
MYILDTSVSPPGAGSISPSGGEYESGVQVTLTANPASGYIFVNWTGDVDSIADVNAATTTITMNDHYSVIANLALEIREIRDWYDLDAIRDNLGGSYLLMSDLDSTTAGYEELANPTANGGKGWEPIGSLGTRLEGPFGGSFDGHGYEISDLFIDRPDEERVGLFGVVSDEGVIENVGLVNLAVTGNEYVGGLVGENLNGTVQGSYSNGNVVGDWHIGGLVGWNWGSVINSYATGSVSGSGYGGGLVGDSSGTVSNSYSTGSVTVHSYAGGLLGCNRLGTVSNSYYNYEEVLINGEHIITIGALSDEGFEQWLANDKSLDVNEKLPQENGYHVISNVSDLKELLAFGQDDSLRFRLKGDLDLGIAANFYVPYLAGEFDGDGHTISGLSLDLDSVSAVGLFGYLAPGGEVTRLVVKNANIAGNLSVGGIVGLNYGSVSNSCFAGSVTGKNNVGSLIGTSVGTVSSCYSTGSVIGQQYVGGLIGRNDGTMDNSYSTGNAIGDRAVGGLVGWNREGTVTMCYATGSVTSNACLGGLTCTNSGTISNSFWDTESSGQATSNGGTGKTTAEMMNVATFSDTATDGLDEPWDITPVIPHETNPAYIWNIVDGQTYPFLSWQPVF